MMKSPERTRRVTSIVEFFRALLACYRKPEKIPPLLKYYEEVVVRDF